MEKVAAAEARMQTALAYVEAYYAGQALALTTLNEMHAHEELEAGKGRLATVAGSSGEVLRPRQRASEAPRTSPATCASSKARPPPACSAGSERPPTSSRAPAGRSCRRWSKFVASHPLVVARQRDIEVTRQEVQVTRLGRKPNWTYELSYGQRQGRPTSCRSWSTSRSRWRLRSGRIARRQPSKGSSTSAEAELEEARRAAAGEYAALASQSARLQERIERFQAGVLTPLKQRTPPRWLPTARTRPVS